MKNNDISNCCGPRPKIPNNPPSEDPDEDDK